jgi:hypothetical protein
MKHFALGLLGLILTIPRVALMCFAWVLITITDGLQQLQDFVDFHAGQPGFDRDDDDFPSTGGAA